MTDAVVIGAGPNGLVAANLLADRGWDVLVLESQAEVGGAVKTDGEVEPGFRHDTFSAFYPLAAASRTIQDLHLEDHGLRWRHAPAVLGNPLPDGSWAVLHRDRNETADGLEQLQAGDGAAWLELCTQWDLFGADLISALLSPFPPVRYGPPAAYRLWRAAGLGGFRMMLMSVRRLAEERFSGEGARLLLAGNALHADFAPDSAGSGVFGLIMAMLAQTVGFPVPEGGAGGLTQALARRLESGNGHVQTSTTASEVVVRSGRAVGVRLSDGTEVPARRAVLASVTAPALYGGLVSRDLLPDRVRRGIDRFEWDPSTVKVDWALSSPAPWRNGPDAAPGTIHVADSVDQLTTYAAQISGHTVPSDPLLLVGQMTTTDASRSPAGTESMWAYCHVPRETRADAGGEGLSGGWDHTELEVFADRMQRRIERYAPGFGDRVLSRRILGPHELQARDANLDRGSINGGTANLHQELVFRPVPGLGRAETPIKGLYLASASAHPGGGVHGASGSNAARAALFHHRLRRR
jgi:phytoene dehydrogenase-like protein